jgi:hypothetical protein
MDACVFFGPEIELRFFGMIRSTVSLSYILSLMYMHIYDRDSLFGPVVLELIIFLPLFLKYCQGSICKAKEKL